MAGVVVERLRRVLIANLAREINRRKMMVAAYIASSFSRV